VIFLPALAIFMLAYRWLKAQQQKAVTLVTHINAKEGLSLDCNLRLGSPGPAFLAFDRTHRKIAGCNTTTGEYQLHDFSWVLEWHITWRNVANVQMASGSGYPVNGSRSGMPILERTVEARNFALELHVANPDTPVIPFYMTERAANTWSARLNAILNG